MGRVKRGQVPSDRMSSSKRAKEIPVDRISALPDSIIVRILSLLDMNQSAITSVLSKRWQSLWTESPRLVFCDTDSEDVRNFVTRVSRTLLICGSNDIDTLSLEFFYEKTFEPDVNVWIDFAIRNKVKRVHLRLMTSLDSDEVPDAYTLPQKMFCNSYLEDLSLRRCVVAPRTTVEWRALKDLTIELVELQQHVMERILSGCPVLHRFVLRYCWGFDRLEVNSKSLYELRVCDPSDKIEGGSFLRISAPYLHSLWLSMVSVRKRRLCLEDISSLVMFTGNFIGSDLEIFLEIVRQSYNDNNLVMRGMYDLLESIEHVKEFRLKSGFAEALTLMGLAGHEFPQSDRTCLFVEANAGQSSIMLILWLLESSPKLETLVIEGTEYPDGTYDSENPKGVLGCDLLHLKTIVIKDFLDPVLLGEPTIRLARILLEHTPALEKMVFNIEEAVASSSGFASSEKAFKMAKTLLSYPRSSPKAVILLS